MFTEIPRERPATPLLDAIDYPQALRALPLEQLTQLADELRAFLLYTVGQTGGHFGAGLGVVELTIALHYVFDTPKDRLLWDVGHQAYPHKILTGRQAQMSSLRQKGGLAPFLSRDESEYDSFGVGHSSTSISAALGMALAAGDQGRKTAVVIGDGAMTAGLAFEAINHLAATGADLLVILNDNAMSISENVGGLANYFAKNISAGAASPQLKEKQQEGQAAKPGSLFTDLGFQYSGPVDGHDLSALVPLLAAQRQLTGPRLLHLVTTKGKGYAPAEAQPIHSHAMTKLEPPKAQTPKAPAWPAIFGDWMLETAEADEALIAITPAMKEGAGLTEFARRYPSRFHDVAIAEQHAVTLAAGLAVAGAKPVVAIYSTFLQRAYDQLIHDVALQCLDVLLAVDRASLLEDGPTHSGVFDLSFARAIPNLVIMAPSSASELRKMLTFGYQHPGPALVRYPRGAAPTGSYHQPMALGRAVTVRQGEAVAILAFGPLVEDCHLAAERCNATLVDMRFVKPLDEPLLLSLAERHQLLVTVEENAIQGGAGSAVNEFLAASGRAIPVLNLGIPDEFIAHDSPQGMRAQCGLDEQQIAAAITRRLADLC